MSTTFDIDKLGVFQVFTGGGTGSGFLIEDRLLLTNCHVVAPYQKVAVEKRDKQRILGTVRRTHPKRDLAIVELASPLEGELLPLAHTAEVGSKQTLHIIGFPVGLPLSVTEGVVSNPKQQLDGQDFVQTDAAINPGGPMLDESKHVVAVTTCKLDSADMLGFGIPAPAVHAFVEGFRGQTAQFGVICPSCDPSSARERRARRQARSSASTRSMASTARVRHAPTLDARDVTAKRRRQSKEASHSSHITTELRCYVSGDSSSRRVLVGVHVGVHSAMTHRIRWSPIEGKTHPATRASLGRKGSRASVGRNGPRASGGWKRQHERFF